MTGYVLFAEQARTSLRNSRDDLVLTKRPSKELLTSAGHPIYILVEEHKIILKFADELKDTAKRWWAHFREQER
jgi:hypothetical protein